MSQVHVATHPLVQHKLAMLRCRSTGPKEFRELMNEVSLLLAYEVTRDVAVEKVEVETPLGVTGGFRLAEEKIAAIPILRAGLGMLGGVLSLIPTAAVGHIGVYRDEATLKPVEYYCKLPARIDKRELIVLDPMLATGGSAVAALSYIKNRGARTIRFMCLIAAPEGLRNLEHHHKDVPIFTGAVDERLDSRGFIFPGLGDAGDRLYGTE
ncbi:MAG: uracil phosphoribosyltransferase [Firmicutes bacterium]|nr:uracil phosphoribosyltransferase [Bacillota bacterium]